MLIQSTPEESETGGGRSFNINVLRLISVESVFFIVLI